jgi:fused signal recognition particle receptor
MEYVALVIAVLVVTVGVVVGLLVRPGQVLSARRGAREAERRPAAGRPPRGPEVATRPEAPTTRPTTRPPTSAPAAQPATTTAPEPVVEAPEAAVETIAPTAGRLIRLRSRLSRSQTSLGRGLLTLLSRDRLDEDTWDEIEETLLAADMGVRPTQELVEALRTRVRVLGARTPADVRSLLRDELLAQVGTTTDRSLKLAPDESRPAVLLVVGVNGTGKTTTCGKLARVLIADGHSVVLGAADTFRAAAADQLETWGGRVGAATVRGPEGGDPASVAFEAVKRGIADSADTVLIDTAGRLHTKAGLMDELGKVKRVVEKQGPVDETLLVLDATTGQNGLTQARVFTEVVDVTGIVLTKLDGTAKGGIVIAVQRELGVPVKLVGLGEGADDLAPFDPEQFVDALLGE